MARIQDKAVLEEGEGQPLSDKAREAGVVRDVHLKSLGGKDKLTGLRLVVVKTVDDDGQPIRGVEPAPVNTPRPSPIPNATAH